MNDLKYCSLFKKYNDDIYDISKICKACVFLPNEGLVLSTNGEVFHVFNTGFKKLGIFSKKNVIDFAHATSIVNSKLAHLILVLTEYEIYGWGQNEYRQVYSNSNGVLFLFNQFNFIKLFSQLRCYSTAPSIVANYNKYDLDR
jgi:hypothetical protein